MIDEVCPYASNHLSLFTLHEIVTHNRVTDMEYALTLLKELFQQYADDIDVKRYIRLTSGLKILVSIDSTLRLFAASHSFMFSPVSLPCSTQYR